jgi:hypothetical protein
MDWLTKPRWWSTDRVRVARSSSQWVDWGEFTYSLSLLGAVNGALAKVGAVLVVEGCPSEKLRLRKRWW